MGFVNHARNIPDLNWAFTFATPAQATTTAWTSIDLLGIASTVAPGINENWEWEIGAPAYTATLINGQSVIITAYTTPGIADSLAGLDPIAQLTFLGAGGVGAPAAFKRFRLPSQSTRYLRLQTAVSATAGSNIAIIQYANAYF